LNHKNRIKNVAKTLQAICLAVEAGQIDETPGIESSAAYRETLADSRTACNGRKDASSLHTASQPFAVRIACRA